MTTGAAAGAAGATGAASAAGWYPDGAGGYRWFDGTTWTEHRAPPFVPPAWGYGSGNYFGSGAAVGSGAACGYYGWAPLPWKGAQLGRPPQGPGSLADPWRRLAARLLDGVIGLPVLVLIGIVTLLVAAPHVGPIFPPANSNGFPGIFWLELAWFVDGFVYFVLLVVYESVATARYGRTIGKGVLGIRPVTVDDRPLGPAKSFGRASLYAVSGFVGIFGLVNVLWCLWDDKRQCVHDKLVETIVVNDR